MQRSNAVIANEAFKALSYRSGSLTLKDLRNAVMCHTRLSSEEAVRALMQLIEDGRLIPDPLRAYCYTVSREPLNIWGRVSYSLNKLIALDPLLYDELIKTFKDAPNFEKLTIRPEGLTPGRWDAFRRQMRYYVELIKRSGGVQSFKAKEQGTVYNFIEGVLPAFSLYDSKRRLERADVTLSGENHFFNEPRWPLVIGFPVEVNYDKEAKAYSFTPVFYLTLSSDVLWSRAHPYLYRNYDASVKSPIQLNGAWADSHRPDGKSAETIARFNEFLQECGLRQRGAFTEQPLSEYLDEEVAPSALKRQGWADHLEILRRYFGALVFEPLSEYRLRSAKSLQEESLLSDCDGKIVNAAVVGLQKGSPFTQSLIRELQLISDPSRVSDTDLEDTALRWFFADPLPSDLVAAQEGVPYTYVCSDEKRGLSLNETQEDAVSAILSSPVSVIHGPPGTGKTQVIIGALYNLTLNHESALISTKNTVALENVIERCQRYAGKRSLIGAFKDQKVAEGNAERYVSLCDAGRKLCAKTNLAGNSVTSKPQEEKFNQYLTELKEKLQRRDICAQLLSQVKTKALLIERFRQLWSLDDKVELLLGSFTVNRKNLRSLEALFEFITEKAPEDFLERMVRRFKICKRLRVKQFLRSLGLPPAFKDERNKAVAGFLLRLQKQGLLNVSVEEQPYLEKQIADLDSEIERFSGLCLDNGNRAMDEFLELTAQNALTHEQREVLRAVDVPNADTVIDERFLSQQQARDYMALKKAYEVLLQVCPHWACKTLSAHANLPLIPGMFDVAIFDEAAQMDYVSAIPVLFRARRVAVIGDPRQLPPVNDINESAERTLMTKMGIFDQRSFARIATSKNTLYSFASQARRVSRIFLAESHRSCSEIVNYISRNSYAGRLQCATDEARLKLPPGYAKGIIWKHRESRVLMLAKSRCSHDEADEAVSTAVSMIESGFEGSIGIISPYKAQAQLIEKGLRALFARFPECADRVTCNSVHAFQGSECDCIIFSPCLQKGSNRFLEKYPGILNVAISRARAVCIVVGDADAALGSNLEALRDLASYAEVSLTPKKRYACPEEVRFESPYEKLLYDALTEIGFKPVTQLKVGHRRLDLALLDEKSGKCLDIEVDGACHRGITGFRKSDDYVRDLEVRELGFQVKRFWTDELRYSLSDCARQVQELWNAMLRES